MGLNVLSLFDGMSCGHLALDKAGIEVETYVASEVKGFAIEHTAGKYPNTVKAGDVTKLHYEGGKLYRDCRRWCVGDSAKFNRSRMNKNGVAVDDYEVNKDNIRIINGIEYIDVVNLSFESDFDENNKVLADYKDAGLVENAATLTDEELGAYKGTEHVVLPNGEIAIWELGEMIYQGNFDVLIGGSPCQDFSVASATNGGKYGLEGSKSRLFFDYLRLKEEVSPKYFFLENVRMRGDSKEMLDNFLGVEGVAINSKEFSIQNRPRVYWTNIAKEAPTSERTSEEVNFQNFKLATLPRLEWALYVKKFPGSYFGYEVGTPEHTKGGFEFDDVVTASTKRIGNQVEGTKEDIRNIVTFKVENGVQIADVSFSDNEASLIAEMPCNKWAREELEKAWGRQITDREFVEEIHNQLYEALVKKSPSRDGMRYGKVGMSSCKDITGEERMSCITRKQDRFPNSGLIAFGPYCRFVTKLEICKGQTVPYEFLSDLSYAEIQDVCGDGWTVDVIASFFENMKTGMVYNETMKHTMNKVATTSKGDSNMSSMKVTDVFNDDAQVVVSDSKMENIRFTPRGFYKVKTVQMSVPDDDAAIKAMREALRPWEKDYVPTKESKNCGCVEEVLDLVRKECGEEIANKIRYELCGWDSVKDMRKEDAPEYIRERVAAEVKEAIVSGVAFDEVLKAKALWIL